VSENARVTAACVFLALYAGWLAFLVFGPPWPPRAMFDPLPRTPPATIILAMLGTMRNKPTKPRYIGDLLKLTPEALEPSEAFLVDRRRRLELGEAPKEAYFGAVELYASETLARAVAKASGDAAEAGRVGVLWRAARATFEPRPEVVRAAAKAREALADFERATSEDLRWDESDVAGHPAFAQATHEAIADGFQANTDGKVLARGVTAWAAVLTTVYDVRLTMGVVRRFLARNTAKPIPPIEAALELTNRAGSRAIQASARELALVAILRGNRPRMAGTVWTDAEPEDAVRATTKAVRAAAKREAHPRRYWPFTAADPSEDPPGNQPESFKSE
jgi:hypothetical protein